MTQQYLYLPMAEAMNDRINSLTYTEVPPNRPLDRIKERYQRTLWNLL